MESFDLVKVSSDLSIVGLRASNGSFLTATPLDDPAGGYLRQAQGLGAMETFRLIVG